jgi:dihydroflavonol-4-reductase
MNQQGLPVTVVNPAFPFGGGDIAPTPTGILIQRYMTGQNPFVFRGGFNAVHVGDVARGHWLAALKGKPGEKYILGGHNVTYRQFADLVTNTAGVKPAKWEVSSAPFAKIGKVLEWVADNVTHKTPVMVDKSLRYSTGRHLWFDIAKAKRELGYAPRPLEDAIAESVRWFRDERDQRLSSPAKRPPATRSASSTGVVEAR